MTELKARMLANEGPRLAPKAGFEPTRGECWAFPTCDVFDGVTSGDLSSIRAFAMPVPATQGDARTCIPSNVKSRLSCSAGSRSRRTLNPT